MNFYDECCQPIYCNYNYDYSCKNMNTPGVLCGINYFNEYNSNCNNNNNTNKMNSSVDDIALLQLKMKVDLLNNKVNQMNDAFSQINLNNLHNQKEKLNKTINSFNKKDKKDNSIQSLTYQFEENSKNNCDISGCPNSCSYKSVNNQQKRANSYYNHPINTNSFFSKYDDYFTPSFCLPKKPNNDMTRNNNNNFSKKKKINNNNNKIINNINQYSDYDTSSYCFSKSNKNYPIKDIFNNNNSKIFNFGSFDSYFIETFSQGKKSGQSSEDNVMVTISNEKEENNIRPRKISNRKNNVILNNENKNSYNNIEDEKNEIENNNNNFITNSINDDNKTNNNIKDNNNNGIDIDNLIIDQKEMLEKQKNNFNNNNRQMNTNTKAEINSNEKPKNSLLDKLFQLGKKNEYNDKIENDNRNKIENRNNKGNKIITSNNYNTSPEKNINELMTSKNFKDIIIDKKIIEKYNKQKVNDNPKLIIDNKNDINTKRKIKKNKNKKVSFHTEDNIIINYDQKNEVTELYIYNVLGKKLKTIPKNINVYLNKLKKYQPKSAFLYANTDINNNTKLKKIKKNKKEKINKNKKEDTNSNNIKKSNSTSALMLSMENINKLKNKYKINDNNLKIREKDVQRKTPKKEICEKFKKNPQNFFTENLCDLVIKSMDLDENGQKRVKHNNLDKNKKRNKNNDKDYENSIDKHINMQAYYNLKKYFEENKSDED